MSEYSMPVLSEQERDKLTDYCKYRIAELVDYSLQARCLKIALAALTAEPVNPADCFCPVYLCPPVPVIKQEGEQ